MSAPSHYNEQQPLMGNQPTFAPPPTYDYKPEDYQHQEQQISTGGYQSNPSNQGQLPVNYGGTVGGYYPQYNANATPISTHDTNVVVVQQQPTAYHAHYVQRAGDNYLTLSITMTILCAFCTGLSSLFCTIPALMFSLSARDAQLRGDEITRQSKAQWSLFCNFFAILWWIFVVIGAVLSILMVPRTTCHYSFDSYYYEYCTSSAIINV